MGIELPDEGLEEGTPAAIAEALASKSYLWPRRLAAMIDVVVDELRADGLVKSPQDQRRIGLRVVSRQCQYLGGYKFYWPKADCLRRALRDAGIWADHDGTVNGPRGISALARRHGVSVQHIWGILRAQRALHRENAWRDSG